MFLALSAAIRSAHPRHDWALLITPADIYTKTALPGYFEPWHILLESKRILQTNLREHHSVRDPVYGLSMMTKHIAVDNYVAAAGTGYLMLFLI